MHFYFNRLIFTKGDMSQYVGSLFIAFYCKWEMAPMFSNSLPPKLHTSHINKFAQKICGRAQQYQTRVKFHKRYSILNVDLIDGGCYLQSGTH